MEKIQVTCEMEVTLKMIGGKCKPLILESLISQGTQRFSQLMRQITQVSQRTLTNQLRELEKDGLICRTVYPQVPPRVEYSITPKGRSLETILELMCEWGEKNMDDRFELTNPQCSGEPDSRNSLCSAAHNRPWLSESDESRPKQKTSLMGGFLLCNQPGSIV